MIHFSNETMEHPEPPLAKHSLQERHQKALDELVFVKAALAAVDRAARAQNIEHVRALMKENGLKIEDLGDEKCAKLGKAMKTAHPALYRDETGRTYGGRGKHPHWLRDALSAGRTLESFRIPA